MASPRSSGSELWRRARIKTVVSRRFTSSSCSSPDEEVGFGSDCAIDDYDEVYLSCFEEDSANVYDDQQDDNEGTTCNDSLRTESIHLRPDSGDRVSKSTSFQSCHSGKRSSYDQSPALEKEYSFFSPGGDSGICDEPKLRGSSDHHDDIDFVDMALSRDNPDMGLGRADPNYNSRERQKLKQDEDIPKLRKFKANVKFGWFDIFIGVVAIIVFFIDIGTDIELAAHYFRQEMWIFGGVTTALIVAPSLITCFLGLHWYIIDYKKEREIVARLRKAKKRVHVTADYVWFIRFACTLLQIGPVIRIIEYLRCGHKSRCSKLSVHQRKRFYVFMLYEDVDSCLLRLFESFLESAPQLTWQLYIAIVLKPSDNVVGTTIRCIALLSSWGSLAISLVSYHKSLRNSHEEKAKMSMKSLPVYFIWRASEVGGRVISIAMFASTFELWVFGPLLFHWVSMSFWLMVQKTAFYKNKCLERVFNVICGYVMVFCFLNLREGATRFRFLFFYIITYTENFVMLAFWFRFTPDLGAWFHLWGFIVVLILFLIHVIFQLLYYSLFHPTGRIEICLPCDPYIIYSSVCYDIQPAKRNSRVPSQIRDIQPPLEIICDVNGYQRSGGGDHRKPIVKQRANEANMKIGNSHHSAEKNRPDPPPAQEQAIPAPLEIVYDVNGRQYSSGDNRTTSGKPSTKHSKRKPVNPHSKSTVV